MYLKEPYGFGVAKYKAGQIAGDGKKMTSLIKKAAQKAARKKSTLSKVWNEFTAMIRMLKAWHKGDYSKIPWKTIIYSLAALIYFVNPFDMLPDFIPFLGYIDDVSIIAFVINALKSDIQKFTEWEQAAASEHKKTVRHQ